MSKSRVALLWLLTVGHLDGPHNLRTQEPNGERGKACPRGSEDFGDTGPLGRTLQRRLVIYREGTEARHVLCIASVLSAKTGVEMLGSFSICTPSTLCRAGVGAGA